MKLTFLIPISVTVPYLSRVEWLRRSLDSLGAPYSDARIGLALSRDSSDDLESTVRSFPEVLQNPSRYFVAAVDRARFDSINYLETGAYRFRMLDDSDVTIFCDADIFFIQRFDGLLNEVMRQECMAGVIARGSPFTQGLSYNKSQRNRLCNELWWNHLFQIFLQRPAPLKYSYSAQPTTLSPFYCNAGFLVASTRVWRAISEFAYDWVTEVVSEIIRSRLPKRRLVIQYAFQIAHALATYHVGLNHRVLCPGFNAWNGSSFCASTGVSPEEIHVIHYYGNPVMNFYKRLDFMSMMRRVSDEPLLDPVTSLLVKRVSAMS